ncbi:carboxypeptidase-like regulatory domain-containing protein [Sabulibacter ruber]|uniref:carboxypeptidase-like regulatory domain-containing protein n=1 Tax=Sabulibacter ruber TaxID=2811901 RepID=UPI001A960C30|nr:carboxypeptidase-like regulatory domain-containing protein [Sabulibacter ruber]
MSRNNLPEDWGPDEHPSLEVLRQYQTGELSAPLSHQVERHLLSCELCSDLVEGMTLAQPARVRTAVRETRGRLKNLLAQKKRKRRVFQWPAWQTAAVLLVLLFALGEVVYHHYFNKSHFGQNQPGTTSTQASGGQNTWKLTGRVLNASGEALSGAALHLKGTTTEVITNADGSFELELPTQKAILVVSHVGYKMEEVSVQRSSEILKIALTQETK